MSSFSSLNTALGALRYSRTAMDVAGSNIANASTEGYTRRRVESASVGAPAQPAMWSRYDGTGDGVEVTGVNRMADLLLDNRVRGEHGRQSYLDTRTSGLQRLEAGVGEPGEHGAAAALAEFRNAWHDLANHPDSAAVRDQVLSRATTLATALAQQSRHVDATTLTQEQTLAGLVDEVGSLASGLADANRAIAIGTVSGTDVNVLLDRRDQLALRLAEVVGGVATVRPDGGADVSVVGVSLVAGAEAGRLRMTGGGTAHAFEIVGPDGAVTALPTAPGGAVGAAAELLDITLPAYRTGLDVVARDLADQVNALHRSGYDASGAPGQDLFAYDAGAPAASLRVALGAGELLAASAVPGGGHDATNADAIATAGLVEGSYQRLVSGLGSTVQAAQRAGASQQAVTSQLDDTRERLSGVSLDEEMVAMMTAQRAYEAAARVMTTLDSVLDTLINRTGLR